jgi:hypothetical protein
VFCSLLIPLGASHVFTQPGVRLCESQDAKNPRRVLSRLRPGIRAHYVDEKCPAASGHFPAEVLMCFAVRSPDRTSISNRTCSYSGMQSLSVAIRGPPRLSRIFHQTPLPSLLARTRPVSSSVARCLSPHLIPLTATVMLQAGKQALCLSLDCIMYCDCKNMVLDELTEFILHSKVLPPRDYAYCHAHRHHGPASRWHHPHESLRSHRAQREARGAAPNVCAELAAARPGRITWGQGRDVQRSWC